MIFSTVPFKVSLPKQVGVSHSLSFKILIICHLFLNMYLLQFMNDNYFGKIEILSET